MLGCNRAGEYPTKFNGGLFIYDPGYVREDLADESADFRMWGGGSHTAQNQRLVYWPMLKSGEIKRIVERYGMPFYPPTGKH